MSEYYSKEKVMETIDFMIHMAETRPDTSPYKQIVVNERWAMKRAIENISTEVVPVVHAKWIETNYCGPHHMSIVHCTNCHKEFEGSVNDKYCPNCGAKMDG